MKGKKIKPETIEKLKTILTAHPGGYVEIIETMLESSASVPSMTWDTNEQGRFQRTDQLAVAEIAAQLVKDIEVMPRFSGDIAALIQTRLMRYHLPVSSDKEWMEPAASWFKVM